MKQEKMKYTFCFSVDFFGRECIYYLTTKEAITKEELIKDLQTFRDSRSLYAPCDDGNYLVLNESMYSRTMITVKPFIE